MKKLALALIVLIMLITSCAQPSNEGSVGGDGYIRLFVSEEKDLTILDAGGISRYQYKASPKFSYENGEKISGVQTEWTTVAANSSSSEMIGPFSQGFWAFQLRAITAQEAFLWEGEGSGYIGASTVSVITIPLHRVPGRGKIQIELSISEFAENISDPIVTIDGKEQTVTWSKTGVGTGKIEYIGTFPDIEYGWHPVTIRVLSQDEVLGDAVAVEILPGETTFIRGNLEVGEYNEPTIKIEHPYATRSEIRIKGQTNAIITDSLDKDQIRTYTCALTTGRVGGETIWFLNGDKVGTGAEYKFVPKGNGTYELTALTRYYAKSSLGDLFIEETSSANVTIFVYPNMSALTWDTGELITRQRLPYDTILTIGAPSKEGYEFSHWAVTGGYTGNIKENESLTLSKPTYNFKAVWQPKPSIQIELTSAKKLLFKSGSTTEIPEEGVLGRLEVNANGVTAQSLALRWFLDGEEVFWVADRGNGTYKIPGATSAGISKGQHILMCQVNVGGAEKKCQTAIMFK